MYYDKYKNMNELYVELKPMSSALVLGLIIITFGFYIINWIYMRNRDFEKLDPKHAPDSKRGAFVLFILPLGWFVFSMIFENLFFGKNSTFFGIVNFIFWLLIVLLILKYLFDFCISFGYVTKTYGLFWFIPFFIGILGIVLSFYVNKLLILSFILIVIIIPAMQEELNVVIKKFELKKNLKVWYG